jgi:hypothetical protein
VGAPREEDGFARYDGGGFALFVHREILSKAAVPGSIRFHFGAYGWCSARLEERDEAT